MAFAAELIEPGTVLKYRDLREYIAICEALGEIRVASGADQYLEIGAICAISRESELIPAVLCDNIPGLEPGFRILLNPMTSLNRAALAVGLPLKLDREEYGKIGPERWRAVKPIPPRVVTQGPILENVQVGVEVNLDRFPRPWYHVDDGGPYPGTADSIVMRDPDSGWVNVGTYRVMYQDATHVGMYINPDNQGLMIRNRYFAQGKPCPVLIIVGGDPMLFGVSAHGFPVGVCEYDYLGGLRGEPLDVVLEPQTGLPMPANAELVMAAEFRPGDIRTEGPFGETLGYYGSGAQELPSATVQAVYFRNQPIMLGSPPGRPPRQPSGNSVLGYILYGDNGLERMRRMVPGVKDLHRYSESGGHFVVMSIAQQYPGHVRQAALALVNGGGHRPRFAVVVDDDVNVHDLKEVLWAMSTRTDPVKDISIITGLTSAPIEPIIPPWENDIMSRAIIDATRPWSWKDQFPKTVEVSVELRAKTEEKWAHVLR